MARKTAVAKAKTEQVAQKAGNAKEIPTPAPKKVVETPAPTAPPAKELAPTTTTPAETDINQTGGSKKKRTFKIKLGDNEFCSRITGHTPKQAASKALTLIVNQKKQTGGKAAKGKVIFTIKETTRNSKGKEYTYQGEKIKLKQPTTYKIRSPSGEMKEIVNRFRNVIEKYQATA